MTSRNPDQLTRDALLSGNSNSLDKSGLNFSGGYFSGDLSQLLKRQESRQMDGAIIVEPLEQVSDVILSSPALKKQISLQSRLSLEVKVLAATAVSGIEPEAGQTLEEDKSATTN